MGFGWAGNTLGTDINLYRRTGRRTLGGFGPGDLVTEAVEVSTELSELAELLGGKRAATGLDLGQGLDLSIELGAFATQLSY
eukprot:gene2450-3189_t